MQKIETPDMAKDLIRYDVLTQDALRDMLRKLLYEIAQTGLPGEHHFYVTFRTTAPGVKLSNRLLERYPEEMTIVLQHQFWDLQISDYAFEIGLSFNGIPEMLHVPFRAIKTFFDPSVQFGLQFDPEQMAQTAEQEDATIEKLNPQRGLLPSERERQRFTKQQADNADTLEPEQNTAPDKTGKNTKNKTKPEQTPSKPKSGADVVSLDAFRKKN